MEISSENIGITITMTRANLGDGKVEGDDSYVKGFKDNIMPAEFGVLDDSTDTVTYDAGETNDWHYAYTVGASTYWDTPRGDLDPSKTDVYAVYKVVATVEAADTDEAVAAYSSRSAYVTFAAAGTIDSGKIEIWTHQTNSIAAPASNVHDANAVTGTNAGKLRLTVASLSRDPQTIMLGYVAFNLKGTVVDSDAGKTVGIQFAALTNSDF